MLQAIPGRVRYVASSHRSSNYGKHQGWRIMAADAAKVNNQYMLTITGHDDGRYGQEVSRGGATLVALDGLLNVLNAAGWGDLFVAGVMPLEASDALALLAHDTNIWLLAAGTVFAVDPVGSTKVAGACNDASDAPDPSRTVVHLSDGRSLTPPEPPQAPSSAPNQGKIFIALKPQPPAAD